MMMPARFICLHLCVRAGLAGVSCGQVFLGIAQDDSSVCPEISFGASARCKIASHMLLHKYISQKHLFKMRCTSADTKRNVNQKYFAFISGRTLINDSIFGRECKIIANGDWHLTSNMGLILNFNGTVGCRVSCQSFDT